MVANNDDFDAEIINNGTVYLVGNKDFELSTAHVKPKIMSIISSRKEYKLISSIEYLQQKRDLRMPNYEELWLVRFWDLLTNKKSSNVSATQYSLSTIYYFGDNSPKDNDKAVYWEKKAANNNGTVCFSFLGSSYSNGEDIEPDYKESFKWFRKAYDTGEAPWNSFDLGVLYNSGNGVERNYSTALELFKEYISNFGDINRNIYFLMGDRYQHGNDGVSQSYQKAFESFFKAYTLNDGEGANRLGTVYYKGLGVIKNDEMAMIWFTKAAAYNKPISWRINRMGDIFCFSFFFFVVSTFFFYAYSFIIRIVL